MRAAGLRATAARVAVLRHLTEAGVALSHAEVAEQVARTGVDRTTVYRNLVDLTDAGLVHRTDLGDHVWRFAVPGAGHAPPDADHPHFVCNSCGAVECLPEDSVAVKPNRRSPRALRQPGLQIQVRGVCDECK